jgi:hypothetical protein
MEIHNKQRVYGMAGLPKIPHIFMTGKLAFLLKISQAWATVWAPTFLR